MIILGLTGGVGMGKSTAALMLRRMNVPVYDADATVHRLMGQRGDAVAPVARAFPDAVRDGIIDRKLLGAHVFGDRAALKRLEAILHPLVRRDELRFLRAQRRQRARLVVLDIPLLFETGGQRRCDAVIAVSAPAFLQRRRVLARPGMNADKLRGILAAQVTDARRRRDADFVVPSGLGRAATFRRLRTIVRHLTRSEEP